jgi:hypothetical protein
MNSFHACSDHEPSHQLQREVSFDNGAGVGEEKS